ncbi:MAG TPA: hypothetical protein VER03_15145 [Bryobacteraceae bacterium]|nr:hypothetical protein [Bryobacteraceae bacterium]
MAHTAVYGIYSTRQDAEMAIDAMRAAGFRAGDISVLFPDNEGTKDIGHEKHTKAPEKATAGAALAGIAGGTIGWLAGIGALAIPGIGPFVAAGPIMAALAGLGAGSVVGGLAGALIGAGIPEYEAKRYEGRIRSGGILLSVHCEDDHMIGRAKELLKHTGAEDIAAAAEGRVSGGGSRALEDDRRPLETHRVVRDEVRPAEPVEHRVSERIVIEDERPYTDTRRVVREERVLTDEELRRRRDAGDPPPRTELL